MNMIKKIPVLKMSICALILCMLVFFQREAFAFTFGKKRESLISAELDKFEAKHATPVKKIVSNKKVTPPSSNKNSDVKSALQNWEAVIKRHKEYGDTKKFEHKAGDNYYNIFESFRDGMLDSSDKYSREQCSPNLRKKHEFGINAETSYYVYEEPDVMKKKGWFTGLNANYSYRPDQDDFLNFKQANYYSLEGSISYAGRIKYEGILQDGLRNSSSQDYILEVRGILGKEFIKDKYSALLYSGFGHRYLNDDMQDVFVIWNNSRVYGYDRESKYYYCPVGFKLGKTLNNMWDVALKMEYDVFLFGKQDSHTGDINPYSPGQYEDITHKQKHGFGLKGSFDIIKKTKSYDFTFGPFIEYWDIEDSVTKNVLLGGSAVDTIEPNNNTLEVGLNLGVKF